MVILSFPTTLEHDIVDVVDENRKPPRKVRILTLELAGRSWGFYGLESAARMRVTVGRLEDDKAADASSGLENPQALDYVDYNLFAQQNPRHTRSRYCHPFLILLSSRFGAREQSGERLLHISTSRTHTVFYRT
jgi:hypothetical protein